MIIQERRLAHASTKGNRGWKLPTGNAALRSPAFNLSAASRNAATIPDSLQRQAVEQKAAFDEIRNRYPKDQAEAALCKILAARE